MRIKVIMAGDEPTTLVADAQLLRDKGLLVYNCYDIDNIDTLVEEIHPDVVFINPQKNNPVIVQAYNNLLNNICFTNIPVIYTLSEDDVYLITRKRTTFKSKRSLIADNITDAIKKALYIQPYHSKSHNKHIKTIPFPSYIASA